MDDKPLFAEGNEIYIKNIPSDLGVDGLRTIVESVAVPERIDFRPGNDFAFVAFSNASDAERALRNLKNKEPYRLYVAPKRCKKREDTKIIDVKFKDWENSCPNTTPVQRNPNLRSREVSTRKEILSRSQGRGERLPSIELMNIIFPGSMTRPFQPNPDGLLPYENETRENGFSKPVMDLQKCLRCGRMTQSHCKDCDSYYCSYICMRQDAEVHASYCNKLTSGNTQSNGHQVAQPAFKNTSASQTTHGQSVNDNYNYGKGDVCNGSVTTRKSLGFKTRFNIDEWNQKPMAAANAIVPATQGSNQTDGSRRPYEDSRNNRGNGTKPRGPESREGRSSLIDKRMERYLVIKPKDLNESLSSAVETVPKRPNASIQISSVPESVCSKRQLPEYKTVTALYKENDGYWVLPFDKTEVWERIEGVVNKKNTSKIDPSLGLVCLALYENQWYRARIKSLNPLVVHFIDYGNTSEIKREELRAVPSEVSNIPGLVYFVRFAPETSKEVINCDWQEKQLDICEIGKEQDGHTRIVKVRPDSLSRGLKQVIKSDKTKGNAEQVNAEAQWAFESLSAEASGTFYCFIDICNGLHAAAILPDAIQSYCEKLINLRPGSLKKSCNYNGLVLVDCKHLNIKMLNYARGSVLVKKSDGSLKVALVDYGIISTVGEVYELESGYTIVPKIACVVNFINVINWSLICDEQKLRFQVVKKLDNRWLLDIKHDSQIVGQCVADRWDPFKEIPSYGLLKSGESVVIQHIQDTSQLYISSCEDDVVKVYIKVLSDVSAHCSRETTLKTMPALGSVVGALFKEDETFYRGQVISVIDEKTLIRFLDFGNQQLTPLKDLRPLPNSLAQVPAATAVAWLRDIPALQSNDALVTLKRLLSDQTPLILKYSEYLSKGAQLFYEDGKSLNEEMKTKATQLLLKEYHDESAAASDFKVLNLPEEPFTMCITYVDKEENGLVYGIDSANTTASYICSELTEKISEFCKSLPDEPYYPRKQEICAALVDDEWTRAVCIDNTRSHESYNVQLFFMDYGNTESVCRSHIRPLPDEFKKYPAVAAECYIKGTEQAKTAEERQKLIAKLESLMLEPLRDVTASLREDGVYEIVIPEIDYYFNHR